MVKRKSQSRTASGRTGRVIAAAVAFATVTNRATAVGVRYSVSPFSGWNSTVDWGYSQGGASGAPVPVAGDLVFVSYPYINQLPYDYNGPAVTLGSLVVEDTSLGSNPNGLVLSGNNLSAQTEYLGPDVNCSGSILQSAGSNSAGSLSVGGSANTSFYEFSGGSLNATTLEVVGNNGSGAVQQSGGSATVGTELELGLSGSGSYAMSAVSSNPTLSVNGSEIVGTTAPPSYSILGNIIQPAPGAGVFTQSAGNHTITGTLHLADTIGSTGTFTLSGGSLGVGTTASAHTQNEYVGYSGVGSFTQTGGTHSIGTSAINNDLIIGNALTSIGSYVFNGDTQTASLTVNGNEYIGYNATGTTNGVGALSTYGGSFLQSGGSHTITGYLILGQNPGATGLYTISAGSLKMGTTGGALSQNLVVGYGGVGTFLQTGGSVTVGTSAANQNLFIGYFTNGGSSSYTLNGASGSLTVNGPAYVGGTASGPGSNSVLNLNAGTAIITGQLTVWNVGAVNLNGGSLQIGSFSSTNPALFNWTGGNLSYNNSAGLVVDTTGPFGSAISVPHLAGLAVAGAITNNGTISLSNSTLTAASASTNSGTISGFGILSGAGWTNAGLIQQTGGNISYNSSGTLTNTANINLQGGQFRVTNGELDNQGAINLQGATITPSGSGTFVNETNGLIVGNGSIAAMNSNNGTTVAQGGLLTLPVNFYNYGVVESSLGGLLSATNLTNAGTISGSGSISGSIANGGTIAPSGGTLSVTGIVNNTFAGTLTATSGNELDLNGGLTSGVNFASIALAGGTIKVAGALNNGSGSTGQIIGYGILTTGGLTNNTTILLAGGSCTINGTLNNSIGATVTVQNANALFTSLVTNNGSFKIVTGGTATFAGGYSPAGGPSNSIVNSGSFATSSALVVSANFTNSGTVAIGGTQQWSSGAIFTNTAGTATFSTDAGASGQNLSVVAAAGTVTFASIEHLASLNVSSGATSAITGGGSGHRSIVYTPLISVTGTIDLTNDDLDVQSPSSLATITALVKQGYSNGTWIGNASGGITSSSAANDSTHLTALGVILNTTYSSLDGNAVALNDVLVKYTYYGDATLNGSVDGSDYSRIDNGYLTHATGWSNGDFNYDGFINGSDYTLIDNAFNRQAAGISSEAAAITDLAAVPEPGCLNVIILIAAAALCRRGQRRGTSQNAS